MAKENLNDALEGLHLDILNDYIDKGKTDSMEPEMVEYMQQLQFIQQRLHRVESPANVVRSLMAFYPNLNIVTARSRFNDALKFFYLDDETSDQAWNNYLFGIAMQSIELAARTVDTPEASLKIVDALAKARTIKGLDKDKGEPIDPRLLEEKIEIFTLTPSDVGLPEANKRLIAEQVDQFPIKEHEKLKIKMDAGVKPREIFNLKHEQTED